MVKKYKELSADKLKRACDPNQFSFKTTEEVAPLQTTVGQKRALNALEFGFGIKMTGFNLYVAGPIGTGKDSTVRNFVKKIAGKESAPSDWCYVYNFAQHDKPLAIELPPGLGCVFTSDMDELIEDCRVEIPKVFEGEEYEKRRNSIMNRFQAKRDKLLGELQRAAEKKSFAIELTVLGIATIPIKDGKPLKREEFDKLTEAEQKKIQENTEELQAQINQMLNKVREMEKETREKISKLDQEVALFAVGHILDKLKNKYKDHSKVADYLKSVQEDIITHLDIFKLKEKKPAIPVPGLEVLATEATFDRYKVNLLVDNCKAKGAPVVIERNPTYYNLVGRMEYKGQFGAMVTDFTMLKAGAIHRANGGYLVLQALDVLTNFLSWDALKRVLESKEVKIQNIGEQFRLFPAATLEPEPIPLNIKVILIGSPLIYYLLYQYDEDFRKLFKVRADFDIEMDNTRRQANRYAAFISARCQEQNLRHFDRSGVAKVVEFGARFAEDQRKLSTRFIEITDLISEASFWAQRDNNNVVKAVHVEKAIEQKIYRSSMIEEKIKEMIRDGTILIDTSGTVAGQVNGISIIGLGDYIFGKPSRITARAYMGKGEVINIEREVKMSGRIHNKGVMILTGYLGEKYAMDKPLSFSASICFEQLYEEVEGDSASSAELYAILSSISGVPLKQGIAVTGSVNQRGEIQPVGGVNRKIEGFFDVCKAKGLNSEQGVIIPLQNVKNLMLKDEVVEAVKKKRFHIYPVRTIEEGIEILTGVEAGKRRADGTYKKGTINYMVDRRLREMAEQQRAFKKKE